MKKIIALLTLTLTTLASAYTTSVLVYHHEANGDQPEKYKVVIHNSSGEKAREMDLTASEFADSKITSALSAASLGLPKDAYRWEVFYKESGEVDYVFCCNKTGQGNLVASEKKPADTLTLKEMKAYVESVELDKNGKPVAGTDVKYVPPPTPDPAPVIIEE